MDNETKNNIKRIRQYFDIMAIVTGASIVFGTIYLLGQNGVI